MKYIGAIDQGTTSTRFVLFDTSLNVIAWHQIEHRQIYPKSGWVEHYADEIWKNVCLTIECTLKKSGVSQSDIVAIGITNQRETVVSWNPNTGEIFYNAIVWQDIRGSAKIESLKAVYSEEWIAKRCGLTFSPYFSASKIAWLLENVPGLRQKAESGNAVFGTIDSFIIWKLTGGKSFITDVTNASRYMLMNIKTLQWDDELLKAFNIPKCSLPQIVSSCGQTLAITSKDSPILSGINISGILGDQQSALFGQACFKKGMAKCTYGTGCFMLVNIGTEPYISSNGLLTTVGYSINGQKPVYALEGSVAVAGSLVQWMRDSLKIVSSAQELDLFASQVDDCGGVYVVPAFSGLFAPYWRSDARGIIAGITGYSNKNHLCRAVLESTAFQVLDIFKSVESDSKIKLMQLRTDGGLTNSSPLMQFQADILGIPVVRPAFGEITALGCACAAALTEGIFTSTDDIASKWKADISWSPNIDDTDRQKKIKYWHKAVEKTFNWVEES